MNGHKKELPSIDEFTVRVAARLNDILQPERPANRKDDRELYKWVAALLEERTSITCGKRGLVVALRKLAERALKLQTLFEGSTDADGAVAQYADEFQIQWRSEVSRQNNKRGGRPRRYADNAARQRAYRARKATPVLLVEAKALQNQWS